MRSSGQGDSLPGATPVAEFPCSVIQERFWALSKQRPGTTALNIAVRYRIDGAFRTANVERALQRIIDRHEILRTSFGETAGRPVQRIFDQVPFKLSVIDLSRLPADQRDTEVHRIGEKEARTPFDLSVAPLLRASLLQLSANRAIILLSLHHLVTDGWSLGIMMRDLAMELSELERGLAADLPMSDLQYADFALWQREFLASAALDGERAYWRNQLSGLPQFVVQPDRPKADAASDESQIRSLLLPRDLSDKLQAFARERGVSLFTAASAALAVMLHRVTGEDEVVFGTQVAGRDQVDLESVVGPVLNSIVLRVDAGGDPTIDDALQRVTKVTRDGLANDRMPFEELTSLSEDPRQPPLYAVNFVLQNAFVDSGSNKSLVQGNFRLMSLPSHPTGALYDLFFFMVGREEGWRISCDADTSLYDAATMDHLLATWRAVIDAFVTDATQPISAIALQNADGTSPLVARKPKTGPVKRPASREARSTEAQTPPRAPRGTSASAAQADLMRITRLNPKGRLTPVIAMNNKWVLYPLAQALGPDRPVIDIQVVDPEGPPSGPLPVFEDLVADAVKLIRKAQPHGPYIFLGHCILGRIAFEAAQQLRRVGERIELVVLEDTWPARCVDGLPPLRQRYMKLLLAKHNLGILWRDWKAGVISGEEFLSRYGFLHRLGILRALGIETPKAPNVQSDIQHVIDSCRAYTCLSYFDDIALFRSADFPKSRFIRKRFDWTPIVRGNLHVFDVSCAHEAMFREPGAREIGQHLARLLAEIEARGTTSADRAEA